MAIVTSDLLTGLLTQFRALFAQEFQAAQAFQGWLKIVSRVPSKGELNTYTWFGTVPKMVDVTHGSPVEQGLPLYSFDIKNKEFQVVIPVERAAIERDRLQLIPARIRQLALEAARHPGELLFDTLIRANANAYDGSAFFADTRTIGDSGNIDNKLTGTGTSVAQFQADLASARSAMRLFKDDKARPMNLIGNVIMVPSAVEQIAWQALNMHQASILQPVVPSTADGVLAGAGYLIIINPYLTDTNDWYLFHVGPGEDRPAIWQVEKEVEITADTNPNSAEVIRTRKFLYSAYGRYNLGLTDPRFGVLTTNT